MAGAHHSDLSAARPNARRRRRRVAAALAALIGLTAAPIASPNDDATVEAAPDDVVAIVFEGTGFGHGRGMSQWGAYGYAVDHGWNWQQILNHYYGGTDASTTPANQRIDVRLTGYDGLGDVGVISHGSPVRWGSFSGASMRADEISPGTFRIYRSNQIACPGTSTMTVPNGPVVQQSGYNANAVDVQRFLKTFHDSTIVIDGYFGPQTAGILASWQQAVGLPVNGARWDADDAARARSIISGSGSAVSWTLVGTHVQTTGNPVRFTTSGGDSQSTDRSGVLGVCSSSGAVTHYRGAIEVVHTSSGNRVVNDVPVEQYVRGVIPKEIAASWADSGGGAGANAVRAQAVAARSYGLSENRTSYTYPNSSVQYATTCDTTSCQVYGGAARRGSANAGAIAVEDSRTDAAVLATANVVRRWPSGHPRAGQIVRTEFSASNGPRTAGGEFPPVDDIGDDTANNPLHRWTRIIDADSFAAQHGLGEITAASMQPTTLPQYQVFDGIWFDDLVVSGTNGTYRRQAWNFRNSYNLPSPGFTVSVVRQDTTTSSLGFIGDSVGRGVTASNGEFMQLTDGTFTNRVIDNVDGRCTTRTACPGTTGVAAAQALPLGLDLVVVELGYNDDPATFGSDIDAMMSALNARQVGQVMWVNLGERRTSVNYRASNAALAAAEQRWSNLDVLDWRTHSDNAESSRWYRSDGVHLTTTGDAEFARWLRNELLGVAPNHYLSPPERIVLPVAGLDFTTPDGAAATVPADAAAVALNITMVQASGNGYATVWPCSADVPFVSNANVDAGGTAANMVIAPVSPQGTVCFYSSIGTDFIVDVSGWFPAGSPETYVALDPTRRIDTRSGIGGRSTPLTASSPLAFRFTGLSGERASGGAVTVPNDALAVALNVTADRSAGPGFITVWPCGTERPLASNVNLVPGSPIPNAVIAPVGDDGTVCFYSPTQTDVVVDLAGYFPASAADDLTVVVPERIIDTRFGVGTPQARTNPAVPLEVPIVGQTFTTTAGDDVTVGSDADAAVINLTISNPSEVGFAGAWPCGTAMPVASNVNLVPGVDRANSVVAPIGSSGSVCVFVNGPADVIVDVSGWFSGGGFVGVVPNREVDTRFGVGPIPV